MKAVTVYKPNGRKATLHVAEGDDWRDSYQWVWGMWPEDDRFIREDPT